tara:strand:- start:358 stop:726 length:369 start_codon:yes stop_codon:yes gene_type:complete
MTKRGDKTNILLKNIIEAIQKMKGKDIVSLDLTKIDSAICKYFIICTGNSNTHVSAIESNIKKYISKKIGEKPWHVEGSSSSEWILMDYSDIVIHVFQEKTRIFYDLESFWGDANFVNYSTN